MPSHVLVIWSSLLSYITAQHDRRGIQLSNKHGSQCKGWHHTGGGTSLWFTTKQMPFWASSVANCVQFVKKKWICEILYASRPSAILHSVSNCMHAVRHVDIIIFIYNYEQVTYPWCNALHTRCIHTAWAFKPVIQIKSGVERSHWMHIDYHWDRNPNWAKPFPRSTYIATSGPASGMHVLTQVFSIQRPKL